MEEGFVQAVGVMSVEPEEQYGRLQLAEIRILEERMAEVLLRLQSYAESWNFVAGFVEAVRVACYGNVAVAEIRNLESKAMELLAW
jgi:hypothetical protein